MSLVPVCTSSPAVTPYARFARKPQFCVSRMPRRISVQCACVSINPGEIVLPRTSKTLAPAGALPRAPTLLMRLFSITMSAFFSTSSPFIVTTVAPRSTMLPLGVFRGTSKFTAISSTSFSSSFNFFGSFFSSFLSVSFLSASFLSSSFLSSSFASLASPSFLSPSFFSSFGGSKVIALIGSRKRLDPTAQMIVFPSSAQPK